MWRYCNQFQYGYRYHPEPKPGISPRKMLRRLIARHEMGSGQSASTRRGQGLTPLPAAGILISHAQLLHTGSLPVLL